MSEIERFERAIQKLESLIPVVNRLETILSVATKLSLMLNEDTDRELNLVLDLQQLAKINVILLEQNSVEIMKRGIFECLDKYEKELTRKERFYPGYPGVPKKAVENND